jgi:hypothetical protein
LEDDMTKLTMMLLFVGTACTTTRQTEDVAVNELTEDCASGSDDTATVQAAITAGTCLPAGTFNVDMAPYGATGRRHDSMLTGATLCGSGQAATTIRFRGDAHALYWAGITLTSNSTLANLRLNSECVTNTIEQSHLARVWSATDHVVIHDVVLQHPKRTDGTTAGDCINVVGAAPPYTGTVQPNHDLQIANVTFDGCARGGIQIARGLDGLKILDSSFAGCGFDIGSEASGFRDSTGAVTRTLSNVEVGRCTFTSTYTSGYALEMEWWQTASIHHNTSDRRPLFSIGSDDLAFSNNHFTSQVTAIVPVLDIEDEGHRITSTNDVFTQTVATDVVRITPHDKNFQADLGDVMVTGSTLTQSAAADFITLVGVTGFSLTNATLVYTGPNTRTPVSIVAKTSSAQPPVTAVPTTGVTQVGVTHVGFP